MELDRLVTIPLHWQQICEESQFNAVLDYMRGKVVEACVRNQLIVCKSSYADESQMARQWVDETGGGQEQAMTSIAEHLTRRELNDYWTVRFWSQR